MKENIYRSVYCGKVDTTYVGKEIKLSGWVNSIRNLGGLLFITLRDESGIVQLISEDAQKYENINKEQQEAQANSENTESSDETKKDDDVQDANYEEK